MTSINLLELIPRCHAGSRAKGFWDVTPNKGQQLMLVISELAEALEADRKGQRANMAGYKATLHEATQEGRRVWGEAETLEQRTNELFAWKIKDSVEDELADAYIRLCDYAGGFDLSAASVAQHCEAERALMDKEPEVLNLGECLLAITETVVEINTAHYQAKNVGIALATTEKVCELFNIDLATHIDLKLRYNATRPAKHGKAY